MLDWRNPADYEYTADLTLHGWAWEFLRRNLDFRARYLGLKRDPTSGWTDESQDEFARLGRDYDLLKAPHPDLTAVAFNVVWATGTGVRVLWKDRPLRPVYSSELWVALNLYESLGPQLKQVEKMFQDFRALMPHKPPVYKPAIKPQPDKYPTYIRALDGRRSGASQREIGEALYPESADPRDAARRALERAEKLSLGGYRDLLYLPDT